MFDDFRESYWWLRDNTPEDARVMAWWDYGYQVQEGLLPVVSSRWLQCSLEALLIGRSTVWRTAPPSRMETPGTTSISRFLASVSCPT